MHSRFKTYHALASSLAVILIYRSVVLTFAILLLGLPARPQSVPSSSQVSANDLARRVVTNELSFQDHHTNWMYRLEKEQYGKKRVEEIVETKEGSLSRLLSINDRPITAKQLLVEDQRVRELMTSPSAQQKLRRTLEAETLQGRRLFKMLPDAFVFRYAGGDGNLVKLSFRPNFMRRLVPFFSAWMGNATRAGCIRLAQACSKAPIVHRRKHVRAFPGGPHRC